MRRERMHPVANVINWRASPLLLYFLSARCSTVFGPASCTARRMTSRALRASTRLRSASATELPDIGAAASSPRAFSREERGPVEALVLQHSSWMSWSKVPV